MALQSTGQGADQIQSGSEAQRPSITSPGQIRFNTNTQDLELYEGGRWVPMRPPVDAPIKDNARTIGLNYNKGLTVTGNNLEALLGEGLDFNSSGQIRVIPDGDIAIAYEPLIASYTNADLLVDTVGGPVSSDLPGNKTVSFVPPKESNAAFAVATVKMKLKPHPDAGKYTGDLASAYCYGNWRGMLSGRNCYAATAANQTRIGASIGLINSFDVDGSGRGNAAYINDQWHIKVEELRWDKNKTEPINVNFIWDGWVRNTSRIEYGAVRIAIMPYSIP